MPVVSTLSPEMAAKPPGLDVTGGGGDASADRRTSHLHPIMTMRLGVVDLYHCFISSVGVARKR